MTGTMKWTDDWYNEILKNTVKTYEYAVFLFHLVLIFPIIQLDVFSKILTRFS
jgi:hypothetical protein